jgi:hypothetical protein
MNKQLLLGIGIGAVAVALLVGAPMAPLAYGLLIFACPLMMIFMHGGHGHNEPSTSASTDDVRDPSDRS